MRNRKPEQIVFELDPGYFMTEKEPGNNYLLFYHEFPMSAAKVEYYKAAFLDKDFKTTFFQFYEYPLSYELGKMKDTVYQKMTGNYDVSYLKGEAQEYHENGFIERYPVNETDFTKGSPVTFYPEKVNPENMRYLDKLIQLCEENGIEFKAAVMPLPAVTLVEYQESYSRAWQYFSSYFTEKNVDFYNFNTEYYDAYSHDITHYADYDGHMNGESAREFSKIFGNIIGE